MKKVFTLHELTQFTQSEKKYTQEIFADESKSPKQSALDTILNFSKVLSVRKSKSIQSIEMVLN